MKLRSRALTKQQISKLLGVKRRGRGLFDKIKKGVQSVGDKIKSKAGNTAKTAAKVALGAAALGAAAYGANKLAGQFIPNIIPKVKDAAKKTADVYVDAGGKIADTGSYISNELLPAAVDNTLSGVGSVLSGIGHTLWPEMYEPHGQRLEPYDLTDPTIIAQREHDIKATADFLNQKPQIPKYKRDEDIDYSTGNLYDNESKYDDQPSAAYQRIQDQIMKSYVPPAAREPGYYPQYQKSDAEKRDIEAKMREIEAEDDAANKAGMRGYIKSFYGGDSTGEGGRSGWLPGYINQYFPSWGNKSGGALFKHSHLPPIGSTFRRRKRYY